MDPILLEVSKVLQDRFGVTEKSFRDQMQLIVPPERIVDAVRLLRDEFGFVMLADQTAVDYFPEESPRFHVLYQLRDLKRMLHIMLRVPLDGNAPHVASMVPVFPNANWFEREIWDMFGITFDGHPDKRRILMPHDWEGHPLRKDYPLGYEEVQFTFNVDEVEMRKPHPKE